MAFRLSKYRDVHFNDIDGTGVFELTTVVYCDTIADLPGADDIEHFHLALGCKAIITDTGAEYFIGSDGQWHLNTEGSGGTAPVLIDKTITDNGRYTATADNADGYKSVSINVHSKQKKDVNFFDCDGTVLYAYTADEFAQLTALPDNPTRDGLTAHGWNWSLSDAKTYVASYGKLNIGQMYTTDDGKTRIYISLRDGRLSPTLGIGINGSVDVDWGDNTSHDTMTGTDVDTTVYQTHTYTSAGDYVISLTVTGSMQFNGNSSRSNLLIKDNGSDAECKVYLNSIKRVEIGQGTIYIGVSAFLGCLSLSSVVIPQGVTTIDDSAFFDCNSLVYVTLPTGITYIGTQIFNNCGSLLYASIPDDMTTIPDSMFSMCSSLQNITIPESVISIESVAFQVCSCISEVDVPYGVTSIGSYAFYGCSSIATVKFPNGLATIKTGAFEKCYGLGKIIFSDSTPATVSSTAFDQIPEDCKIYVPEGSLSAYTSAENYPDGTVYTYIEY